MQFIVFLVILSDIITTGSAQPANSFEDRSNLGLSFDETSSNLFNFNSGDLISFKSKES